MSINTAVNVDVNVKGTNDIKNTGKEIQNLNKVSTDLKTGLKDASNSITAMGSASGGLSKHLNGVSANFTKLGKDLSAIPGPVGLAVQSMQGLGTAFKVIVANPIGLALTAIVGALTALYKAFTSTKEGAETMSRVTASLGAVMDVLRDQVLKVSQFLISAFKNPQQALKDFANLLKQNIINRFEGLLELIPALGKAISLVFKGEFTEAGKTVVNATSKIALGVENVTDKVKNFANGVKEVIDEASKEARLASNIERRLQRIADAERALSVERAKQNKIIQEAKLAYQDETLTIDQRRKALETAVALENSLANQELSLAKQRAQAIKERNALSDSSAAALDEEAAAQRRVFELQQQSFAKQTEVAGQIRALIQQQRALELAEKQKQEAEEKRIADEKLKREQEDARVRIELEKKVLEEQRLAAEEKKRIEDAKRQAELDTYNASQELATALVNLIGNQTKLGKGIALAQIGADTARALSGALANSNSPTPDNVATGGLAGIAKYIALASTIAINAKRAIDIVKSGNVSKGASIGSAPSTSVSVPTTLRASSVNVGNEFVTADRRVYVLQGDITRTINNVNNTRAVSVVE